VHADSKFGQLPCEKMIIETHAHRYTGCLGNVLKSNFLVEQLGAVDSFFLG